MRFSTRLNRSVAIGLLAATAAVSFAPAAIAGNDRHRDRRYKRVERRAPAPVHRNHWRVVQSRHSHSAPVLAGLIGGFILGSTVSSARSQPIVVRERVVVREARGRYFDPYCETWYGDLGECRLSMRDHRHPLIVQVIDSRRDECVETVRWERNRWERTSDDYRDWDY